MPEASENCWQQRPFANASNSVGKRWGRNPAQRRTSSAKPGSRRARRQNGATSRSSANIFVTRAWITVLSAAPADAATNAIVAPCCFPRRSADPRARTIARVHVPSSSTRSIRFRVERRRTRAVSAKSRKGDGLTTMRTLRLWSRCLAEFASPVSRCRRRRLQPNWIENTGRNASRFAHSRVVHATVVLTP